MRRVSNSAYEAEVENEGARNQVGEVIVGEREVERKWERVLRRMSLACRR